MLMEWYFLEITNSPPTGYLASEIAIRHTQDGEITHCLTILTIGSDMTRLGNHADLCDKLGIRHTQARIA